MPEVETMVERLQKWVGWRIISASAEHERYLPGDERTEVEKELINGIFRRGKYIVFTTSRGAILCHNAMSGYWDTTSEPWTFDYVEGSRESNDDDVRVRFLIEGPIGENLVTLRFHDARKFGSLRFMNPEQLAEKLSEIGPEILQTKHVYEPTSRLLANDFFQVCKKSRKKTIKEVLMEQKHMAGVGNIYASEACSLATVRPTRVASELSETEMNLVYNSAAVVMAEALMRKLDYGGLKVYRRKTCGHCKTGNVVRELVKGRATFWCERCQR